jgi:hypothetical protein
MVAGSAAIRATEPVLYDCGRRTGIGWLSRFLSLSRSACGALMVGADGLGAGDLTPQFGDLRL